MKTQKTLFKSLISIAMSIIMLAGCVMNVYASDVMPIMDNCDACSLSFAIFNDTAAVDITYYGKYTFTHVSGTVKIQKRFLGIFWSTVDIGYPNNTWSVYSTELDGYFYNEFPISDTGTYRAVFDLDFYGTNGLTDNISEKMQFEYNG